MISKKQGKKEKKMTTLFFFLKKFRKNKIKEEEKKNKNRVCETPENPDFPRKDKMIISIKIRNFSRSRMTKRISLLESSREI